MRAISGEARVAGVVGWPVAHSLSPRLHGYWLQRHGVDGAYIPLPVRPEDLLEALAALPKLGFQGVNVTVPHKEAALAAVTEASLIARRVGVLNTIVVGTDGRLYGDNTDGYGFIENVKAECPDWIAGRGPAVVVGGGGAARAVSAALIDAGVPELRLVNRTHARAEAVASAFDGPIRVVAWQNRADTLVDAALLVNATTLGMRGHPPLDLDLAKLPLEAVVTDIVYTPISTPLLEQARARGNPTADGLGMLLRQAQPGFAAWFGVEPEVTPELRSFVLAGLEP